MTFIIGLFVGATIGIILMGMITAGKIADRQKLLGPGVRMFGLTTTEEVQDMLTGNKQWMVSGYTEWQKLCRDYLTLLNLL